MCIIIIKLQQILLSLHVQFRLKIRLFIPIESTAFRFKGSFSHHICGLMFTVRPQLKRMQEMLNKMQQQMHEKDQWCSRRWSWAAAPPGGLSPARQRDLRAVEHGYCGCWLYIYPHFGASYSFPAWRAVCQRVFFFVPFSLKFSVCQLWAPCCGLTVLTYII